jgi:mannose-6-phosphate isomerase-like protein (cupin superfamily)
MITKRDLLVAGVAICLTLTAVALGQSDKRLMGSRIIDWNGLAVKPTNVGARRDVFQSPTATLDELECHITTINAGESPHAPHQHPDEEMIIIKDGTLEALAGDQTRTVGPGSLLFFASNQTHGVRNVGKTPATYFVVRWKTAATPKDAAKK